MNFRRIVSSWQGLVAGLVALAMFLISPVLLRLYDPTAGLWDAGVLQWLVLATVAFCWGVFIAWVGWQIAFPSTDKAADEHLSAWFDEMSPWARWVAVQATFVALLALWVAILFAVPR